VGVAAAVVAGSEMIGVGVGAAVVATGLGLLVVGAGAGLLVVGAGAAEVVADLGAAVEAFVVAGDVTEPWVAAAAAAAAWGPQVTVYVAGLDDMTAGLVTTSFTFPLAGTHAWNVSASAAFVPPAVKVAESGLVCSPSDIAQ
jgi:hypothetical protein